MFFRARIGVDSKELEEDWEDEADKVGSRQWGNPRNFSLEPVGHFGIEGVKAGMDFETAAKLSGSRFVVLSGGVVRIHRALAQFMIDFHTEHHGYELVVPPYLVNADALTGTGQLPKFAEDVFHIPSSELYLIPTAEVSLTNLFFRRNSFRKRAPDSVCCFYSVFS